MRALIALLLLFGLGLAAAPRAADAADGLRYGPLPIERQIEVLADAGAVDELTARALRQRGLWAARVLDMVTVAEILIPLAEAGDQEAIFAIAGMDWRRGRYFEGSVLQISRWLAPYIEAGDFEAVRLLTMLKLEQIADDENAVYDAMARLQPGVDAGHAPSMRSLGALHLAPNVEYRRSYDRGEELLESAIELGDAEAAGELGEAYRFGRIGLRLLQGSNADRYFRLSMKLGGSRKALDGLAAMTPLDRPYEKFGYAKQLFEEYGTLEGMYQWMDAEETSWDFLQMVYWGAWEGFEEAAWFLAHHYSRRFSHFRPGASRETGRIVALCNFVRGAGWAKIANRGLRIWGRHPYWRPPEIWRILNLAQKYGGFSLERVDAMAEDFYDWFQAGDPAATDGLDCPPIAPVEPFVRRPD